MAINHSTQVPAAVSPETHRDGRRLPAFAYESGLPGGFLSDLYAIKCIVDRVDSIAALAAGSKAEGFRHLEGWRIVECETSAAGDKLQACIDELEGGAA